MVNRGKVSYSNWYSQELVEFVDMVDHEINDGHVESYINFFREY